MIPHKKEHEFSSSGVSSSRAFTFEMNTHMAQMLSDGLYSNKIEAPQREYLANAYDFMAPGARTPIVHMCTVIEPWWSIEDFNLGMDEEEFDKYFCRYGSSNKRELNYLEGLAVRGEKGLGCKSWAAYTDQCTVIATKDGVRRTFSIYKDDTGMPSATKLNEEAYGGPNGVKVSFGVLPGDVEEFQTTAKQLFRRFSPAPIVEGMDDFVPTEYESTMDGKGWLLRKEESNYYNHDRNKAYAIQGNIAYPIDSSMLDKHLGEDIRFMSSMPFDIEFENGSLEVINSREALAYKEHTIEAIVKRFTEIRKELQDDLIPKIFDECTTKWEATKALAVLVDDIDNRDYRQLILSLAEFNGEGVRSTMSVPYDEIVNDARNTTVYEISERRFGNKTLSLHVDKCSDYNSINMGGKTEHLIIRATTDTARRPSRLQQYMLEKYGEPNTSRYSSTRAYPQVILIVSPDDEYEDYVEDIWGGHPIEYFDTLIPEYKPVRSPSGTKKSTGPITTRFSEYNSGGWGDAEGLWRNYKLDITTEKSGYYVDLRSWFVHNTSSRMNLGNIRTLRERCTNLGIISSADTIVGVVGGQKNPLTDMKGWKNLVTEYDRVLTEWEASDDAPDQVALATALIDQNDMRRALALFNEMYTDDDGPIKAFRDEVTFTYDDKTKALIQYGNVSGDPSKDWETVLSDKYVAIMATYPMLKLLTLDISRHHEYNRQIITNYITLITNQQEN